MSVQTFIQFILENKKFPLYVSEINKTNSKMSVLFVERTFPLYVFVALKMKRFDPAVPACLVVLPLDVL